MKLSASHSRTSRPSSSIRMYSLAPSKPKTIDFHRAGWSMHQHSKVLSAAKCMQGQDSGATEVAQIFNLFFFLLFQCPYPFLLASPHNAKHNRFILIGNTSAAFLSTALLLNNPQQVVSVSLSSALRALTLHLAGLFMIFLETVILLDQTLISKDEELAFSH